jgi:hypothetical protein
MSSADFSDTYIVVKLKFIQGVHQPHVIIVRLLTSVPPGEIGNYALS